MQDQLDRIERTVTRLDESIRGDGTSAGLVGRVHTLEQSEKRRAATNRAAKGALATAAAALATALTAIFNGR